MAADCPAGFTCEVVAVPRDHADPGAGTLPLTVARHDASAGAGKPLLLAFVGGPGGAAIPQAPWFAEDFAPALSRYQLVVFDPRGTGATAVRCPSRQRIGEYAPLRSFVSATERCGRRLGGAAGDYQTAATVADIEAIRATLGAERVAIYGVSYGTNVAQRYLLAHPQRLEALVLDSVVGPGGLDPFSRSTFRAVRRVMRALQPGTVARTRKLLRRLRHAPLRGSIVGGDGKREPVELDDALDLLYIFLAGDSRPTYRHEYPAAVRAALKGHPAALLRLHAGLAETQPLPPSTTSDGLYAATTCTDTRLPYPLDSDPADRRAAIGSALAAIPRRLARPFDRATVLRSSLAAICRRWPALPLEPQSVPDAYPAVPTLLLSGSSDTSTPVADARAVASRIPGSTLITLAGTGHAVIASDASGCALDAANRLLLGRTDLPTCEDVDNGLDAARARMRVRLRDVEPQPAGAGRTGELTARGLIRGRLVFRPRAIIGRFAG
jgi:pimeloyl-ACP methyl ester carboxylesterase